MVNKIEMILDFLAFTSMREPGNKYINTAGKNIYKLQWVLWREKQYRGQWKTIIRRTQFRWEGRPLWRSDIAAENRDGERLGYVRRRAGVSQAGDSVAEGPGVGKGSVSWWMRSVRGVCFWERWQLCLFHLSLVVWLWDDLPKCPFLKAKESCHL